MRFTSLLAFCVLGMLCLPLSAQFRINSNNLIQIGYDDYYALSFGEYTGNPSLPNNGLLGLEYWDGGMNFYIPWPTWNYGNYKLFIANWGDVGIGHKPTAGYTFDVLGTIRATGNVYGQSFVPSDSRRKTNVEPLEGSLDLLIQLNSVSYRYLPRDFSQSMEPGEDAVITDDKQRTMEGDQARESVVEDPHSYKGFIAQEVAEVFPELVRTDPEGFLALDYNSFIALLVDGMQEQQTQIEDLTARLEALETQVSQAPALAMESSNNPELGALSQNNPNPFTESTEIGYKLIPNARSAQLMIFDFQGQPVKTFDLELRTEGSFTLEGSELRPGLYFYVLIVDGAEADLKRMILTE